MKRVTKFGLVVAAVITLSGLAINKILEEPTTSCVDEVAELTKASDALGAVLLSPSEMANALGSAVTSKTNVTIGAPYLTVAALGNDMVTVYVKVLLEDGKNYSSEIEEEVKQVKAAMHKDEKKCSMEGKKYEIYRAKTTLGLIQKMSNPI